MSNENDKKSVRVAIFPIFNFELSETLDNGFLFSNKVLLRKITKEEIDLFRREHPIMWSDGAQLVYFINDRTLVYEVKDTFSQPNQNAKDQANSFFTDSSRLVYAVQLAMRLQEHESVFVKLFIIKDSSKILIFGVIFPPAPWKPSHCTLSNKEIAEVDSLVCRISKLDLENNSPFRVACERLSRSYEERRIDDKIIDLTIGFEALFTDYKTPKLEFMGKFVGLGCSMLLGKDNEERQFVAAFLEKAFDIRNKIVHGNAIQDTIEVKPEKASKGIRYTLGEFFVQFQKYLGDSLKRLI